MLRQDVSQVESVEDLFALLQLDFDAHTVRVHRFHILRSFGELVQQIESRDPPPTEEERRLLYASALLQAHDLYLTGRCSCEPPVFPGLQKDLIQLRPRK
jgi:nitrogenase-stabilizing/protective protein